MVRMLCNYEELWHDCDEAFQTPTNANPIDFKDGCLRGTYGSRGGDELECRIMVLTHRCATIRPTIRCLGR